MIAIGLAATAVLAIGLGVAMWRHEQALASAGPPKPRVVAFELAGTGRASHELLSQIGPRGRAAMRTAIGIDRWIIVGYALGLAVLSLLSIWVIRTSSDGVVRVVGTTLACVAAVTAIVAGAFDVRENAKLIAVLDAWREPSVPDGTSALDEAAIRQAHRREQIAVFDRPAGAARRAAIVKFGLLAGVAVWGLAIACIAVTHDVW